MPAEVGSASGPIKACLSFSASSWDLNQSDEARGGFDASPGTDSSVSRRVFRF